MTREEAKQEYWITDGDNNVDEVIDSIYDDFESRTCENCKHNSIGTFCEKDIRRPLIAGYVDIKFGCNKFK